MEEKPREFSLRYIDDLTENYWCGTLSESELDILWAGIDSLLDDIRKERGK